MNEHKRKTPTEVYFTQSIVFIVFLTMTIIEFFWFAIVITDSDPLPTTGEYYGFMLWSLAKCIIVSLPVFIQRSYTFTFIVCLPILALTLIWSYLLVGQSYQHLVYKAPQMLVVCDAISIVSNVIIIVFCLSIVFVWLKKRLKGGPHIV